MHLYGNCTIMSTGREEIQTVFCAVKYIFNAFFIIKASWIHTYNLLGPKVLCVLCTWFPSLQGESPTEWRTTDFRMFRGGSLWRPPILNNYSQRGEDKTEVEEDAPPEEEVKKGQLRSE